MSEHRKLKALPSQFLRTDLQTLPFDPSFNEETEAFCIQLCNNVSEWLSMYFSSHPENWKLFLNLHKTV